MRGSDRRALKAHSFAVGQAIGAQIFPEARASHSTQCKSLHSTKYTRVGIGRHGGAILADTIDSYLVRVPALARCSPPKGEAQVLADTIDSYLVGVLALAGFADLRDHAVRLMKRRGRHGLCRRCDG
jgi:hypothetical protein